MCVVSLCGFWNWGSADIVECIKHANLIGQEGKNILQLEENFYVLRLRMWAMFNTAGLPNHDLKANVARDMLREAVPTCTHAKPQLLAACAEVVGVATLFCSLVRRKQMCVALCSVVLMGFILLFPFVRILLTAKGCSEVMQYWIQAALPKQLPMFFKVLLISNDVYLVIKSSNNSYPL